MANLGPVLESDTQQVSVNVVVFAVFQLYRSSVLFETIRHETQLSTDYKLSLFDLQTSSYQALQRVLVSLGDLTLLSVGGCFFFGV